MTRKEIEQIDEKLSRRAIRLKNPAEPLSLIARHVRYKRKVYDLERAKGLAHKNRWSVSDTSIDLNCVF